MKKLLLTLILGLTVSSNMLAMNDSPDKIKKKTIKLFLEICKIYEDEAEHSMFELPSVYKDLDMIDLKKRVDDKYKELRSTYAQASTLEELSLVFKHALLVGKLHNAYKNKVSQSTFLEPMQRLSIRLFVIKVQFFVENKLANKIAEKLIYTRPESYRKQFLKNLNPKIERFFSF